MKRRDVIKLGAVALGATAGAPGCALPRTMGTLTGADGAAAFNAILDEQLAGLAKPGLLHRLVTAEVNKPLSAAAHEKIAPQDELFRRLLGTLLITQGFRDLPPETQVEPAVQARMWRHMDQIGSMVFDVSDMLAALDDTQRADVKTKLRNRPDLPMALGEALDEGSGRAGLTATRRLQLRKMMSQSAFRLRHGDPSSIIDEYVGKIDRLRESSERDGEALDLAKQLGEREFWRYQHLLAQDSTTSAPPATSPSPTPPPVPPPVTPAPAIEPRNPAAAALFESARTSARAGLCETTESYGERILAIDPDYYESAFRADPEIAACIASRDRQRKSAVPPPAAATEPKEHAGAAGLRGAGYLLGIGVITGVVGAVIVSAGAFAGVFAVTLGVVLFGIGLLVLLISAIVYAASDE